MADQSKQLQQQIQQAFADKQPLLIQAGNSKSFMGNPGQGNIIDLSSHSGIIDYQPTELMLRAHSGTPLAEINTLLAEHQQWTGFNSPLFTPQSTLGGSVSCNQSGPQAPFNGSIRDAILGVTILDGQGTRLEFGGQVMKNVAGYDVSRFMSGAFGTLGILLDITIKLIPTPASSITIYRDISANESLSLLTQWINQAYPIKAACHDGERLYVQLVSSAKGLDKFRAISDFQQLGSTTETTETQFWDSLRDHTHSFFNTNKNLWRIAVPPITNSDAIIPGEWLIDWAGAQRWLKSEASANDIRAWANSAGGYATLFRRGDHSKDNNDIVSESIFEPLPPALMSLHQKLKQRFDPAKILNRGRLYPELDT